MKKNLSDSEIIQMLGEFRNLTESEKASRLLGEGNFKSVYDIPNSGMVLKVARDKKSESSIPKEYVASKKLKSSGVDVETPIMVSDPVTSQRYLIQKKMLPASEVEDRIFRSMQGNEKSPKQTLTDVKNAFENIKNQLSLFKDTDIGRENIGVTEDDQWKMIDVHPDIKFKDKKLNQSLKQAKSTASLKTTPKNLKSLRIFRMLPLLKTAGKVGVPLAGAYSSYSEAREEGLPAPLAAAYAGAEELNPIPISGIDFYKGVEKTGEGRSKNIEANYMPKELEVENEALRNYQNSPASKDRAFKRIKDILRSK